MLVAMKKETGYGNRYMKTPSQDMTKLGDRCHTYNNNLGSYASKPVSLSHPASDTGLMQVQTHIPGHAALRQSAQ